MSLATSPAISGEPLARLLLQAGVTTSNTILVTGPSGLSALLWLCRRGYEHVGYIRSSAGCGAEAADALLIAQTCEAAELERLLANAPHMRGGAVLVCQCRHEAAPFIDRILARHGFIPERRLCGAHREILVARRDTRAGLQAA